MRLIPVQYLRVGDVIDTEREGVPYLTVEGLERFGTGPLWEVTFDQDAAWIKEDKIMKVVGHELEVYEDDALSLTQQEWNIAQKRYVAEYNDVGQAD